MQAARPPPSPPAPGSSQARRSNGDRRGRLWPRQMAQEDFCSAEEIAQQRWPMHRRRRTPPRNPSQMRTRMQSGSLEAFPLAATVRPRFPRASRCTQAPGAARTVKETKSVRQQTPQELKLARLDPTLRSEKSGTVPPRTAMFISKPRTKIYAPSDSKIAHFRTIALFGKM